MNVYTHYKVEDGMGLRWRTILQYGDSWEVIGSMVMINPGSSKPLSTVTDTDTLSRLEVFDELSGECGTWYQFTEDSAMIHTGELFAQFYGKNSRHELSGVIQIFNLFYNMSADLEKALFDYDAFTAIHEYPTNAVLDAQQLIAPVYVGFGKKGFDKRLREKAECFFDTAYMLNAEYAGDKCYLNPLFDKNSFTYPSYLMGRGKNQKISVTTREKFFAMNPSNSSPEYDFGFELDLNLE